MFHITIACTFNMPGGLADAAGHEAARDITQEFTKRGWQKNVSCDWDGSRLILRAENDFDDDGRATMDEFGDSIVAYVSNPGSYRLSVESVAERKD